MEKWVDGKKLIARWGIKGFEIFDYMKKGLPAYTIHGKRIVDADSLERAPKNPYEEIEKNVRTKKNARVLGGPGHVPPQLTEGGIKAIARRIYNSQPLIIINPFNDSITLSFTVNIRLSHRVFIPIWN